jgi:hypothetical protein
MTSGKSFSFRAGPGPAPASQLLPPHRNAQPPCAHARCAHACVLTCWRPSSSRSWRPARLDRALPTWPARLERAWHPLYRAPASSTASPGTQAYAAGQGYPTCCSTARLATHACLPLALPALWTRSRTGPCPPRRPTCRGAGPDRAPAYLPLALLALLSRLDVLLPGLHGGDARRDVSRGREQGREQGDSIRGCCQRTTEGRDRGTWSSGVIRGRVQGM